MGGRGGGGQPTRAPNASVLTSCDEVCNRQQRHSLVPVARQRHLGFADQALGHFLGLRQAHEADVRGLRQSGDRGRRGRLARACAEADGANRTGMQNAWVKVKVKCSGVLRTPA